MATIKDVAKQAGVSVTTVSIIINGKAEERKEGKRSETKVQRSTKSNEKGKE
jgi:LacI family purine nucleotide synthesis repressor